MADDSQSSSASRTARQYMHFARLADTWLEWPARPAITDVADKRGL